MDLSWPDDLEAFASSWLAELRAGTEPHEGDFSSKVVIMNFFGSAATQWTFLCAAVAAAQSDDELGDIAAGPFEHLLGTMATISRRWKPRRARMPPSPE